MRKNRMITCTMFVLALTLTGCSFSHTHVYEVEVSKSPSTCTTKGQKILKCSRCEEVITEEIPQISHEVLEWKTVIEPTLDEWGLEEGKCTLCGNTVSNYLAKIGFSKYSPLKTDVKSFYREICNGKFEDYVGKYVQLSGKVTYISSYSDMIGYYLYGKQGEGVCCWVYSWQTNRRLAEVGDSVTFIGKVENEGINHVELTYCEIIKE